MLSRHVSRSERRAVLFHYLLILPLFEALVIWGPHLDIGVAENSPGIVVTWMALLGAGLLLLALGFWSARAHLFSMQLSQVMQLPGAMMFLCDRVIYHRLGVEAVFICALLAVVCVEIFYRGGPLLQTFGMDYERFDDGEVREEDLRSFERVRQSHVEEVDFNYESGIEEEVKQQHKARTSTAMLLDFMKAVSNLNVNDFKTEEERRQFEGLQRQASLFSLAIPVAPGSVPSDNVSGSAQLHSQGNQGFEDESDI